jgi:hypothetical protein
MTTRTWRAWERARIESRRRDAIGRATPQRSGSGKKREQWKVQNLKFERNFHATGLNFDRVF